MQKGLIFLGVHAVFVTHRSSELKNGPTIMEQATRSRTARRAHSHASVLGDDKPVSTRILHLLTAGIFIGVRLDKTLLQATTAAELSRSHLQHFQRNALVVAAGRLLPSYYREWDHCLFGDDLGQESPRYVFGGEMHHVVR